MMAGAFVGSTQLGATQRKHVHILWRNGWNLNNIGDIGHVPGALALLKRYIPEAKVTLWAHNDLIFRNPLAANAGFKDGVVDAGRIHRRIMPSMELVTGRVDAAGKGDNAALEAAVTNADVMVIGSGAGVLEAAALNAFRKRCAKPTGMFGITTDPFNFTSFEPGSPDVEALRHADFVFTRETASLAVMAGDDIDGPAGTQLDDPRTVVNEAINRKAVSMDSMRAKPQFMPDTTFAFSARDDAAASEIMRAHALERRRFAVFVPRFRWTPYDTPTRQGDSRKVYNDLYVRADHDKLRQAIIDYVRGTGHKVLIAPETVQVVGQLDVLLKDGLPADVASKVAVMTRYWLPDAAASLFAHATVVVSIENHSPILAAAAGTPFVMVHQTEDSFKSQMFSDLGFGDWHIRDIGKASGAEVSQTVMRIVSNQPAARRKVAQGMRRAAVLHKEGMLHLRRTLGLSRRS